MKYIKFKGEILMANTTLEKFDSYYARLVNPAKKKRRFWIVIFIAFLISIAYLMGICDAYGGIKEALRYPEKEYTILEQEVNNCIVPGKSISIEHLKGSNILYKKEYTEATDVSGSYKLTLEIQDGLSIYQSGLCEVCATISEDIDIQTLKIDRSYKKAKFYTTTILFSCIAVFFEILILSIIYWILFYVYLFILRQLKKIMLYLRKIQQRTRQKRQ